ncbi:hypothetical protein CGCF415_v011820 [Colletotrichum fructicola]|uniref:Uncharacterized protein n=1 Tax=Colletotrichum fructicola (strain Nara gc5) TaxID=1213859 RepID=A0A7J6IX48_COLFN|nr:hypothetical protein CGGC5_v010390 [Colletotrichum fructicola Nara gc5]KAF4895769.1 hypothetical protein CGCF415_v011820 [Colletotrichum fructicola]KAF4897169.1 hypothetical protein CGCFRS4_v005125 [Colletotrichum fructicola]KAF4937390.1 hypothetical protein CGCF245_v005670 [Colletotrichum fructicola]KAF5488018.1 hypothetical protein CGCF413_v011990 [Colletotrichum fructicola]
MTIVEHCEELTVLEPRARLSDHAHIGRSSNGHRPNSKPYLTAGNTARLFLKDEPCDHRVLAEPDSYHAITARHHETSDYRFENLRD